MLSGEARRNVTTRNAPRRQPPKPVTKKAINPQTGTYANAVKDVSKPKETVHAPSQIAAYDLPDDCIMDVNDQLLKLLVKVKDPKIIPNFSKICEEEGFDVSIGYVGEDGLPLNSPSVVQSKKLGAYLHAPGLKRPSRGLLPNGAPSCFGKDDVDYPLASRRCCIIFKNKKNLEDMAYVNIRGVKYEVHIKELQEWEADLSVYDKQEDGDSNSSSDDNNGEESDSDHEVNNDQVNNNNECEDKQDCHHFPESQYHEADFCMHRAYSCGVTERKKRKNKSHNINNLFDSDNSHNNAYHPVSETQNMEKVPNPSDPNNTRSGSQRSFNSKGGKTNDYEESDLNRLFELGNSLGIQLGSREELIQKFKRMGDAQVDP
ncbi:hypothetical protein LXL04_014555 [Taraxacum kok-saghyz]